MSVKAFDLNIEKILENWEVRHAVREIIANALDEQLITGTASVSIQKKNDYWLIRDFGRGLKYTHLTQNENQEKLNTIGVIGRFGIGLKDALATFERNGVKCEIQSRYGKITTSKMSKQGFGDVTTLHAVIEETSDTTFEGTVVALEGVSDDEMQAAKDMFLALSHDNIIDTTKYGQIINRAMGAGKIFINGVLVAEEENFLFSFNITQMNAQLKKAINRERTHVGRSAYTDLVKKILLSSSSKYVADLLAEDMSGFSSGTMHDELSWIDVQEHAITLLNKNGNIVFVTSTESMLHPNIIDDAIKNGTKIITIPDNLRYRLTEKIDEEGNSINDITRYIQNYNESFRFEFVDENDLTSSESKVFSSKNKIVSIFGGIPENVSVIKISETLRPDILLNVETLGCWDSQTCNVIISRRCLSSVELFSGVLIHELLHAKTGFKDVSREFETALTESIGKLCNTIIENKRDESSQDSERLPSRGMEKPRRWYKFW
ncbi:sensor histidine kinase [Citrobacter amalonaticus]|nr:sensor histidine kinase [Citrobacter amalonaticus]